MVYVMSSMEDLGYFYEFLGKGGEEKVKISHYKMSTLPKRKVLEVAHFSH